MESEDKMAHNEPANPDKEESKILDEDLKQAKGSCGYLQIHRFPVTTPSQFAPQGTMGEILNSLPDCVKGKLSEKK